MALNNLLPLLKNTCIYAPINYKFNSQASSIAVHFCEFVLVLSKWEKNVQKSTNAKADKGL